MNTNILKRFAKDARIKLLDQVGRKLEFVLTHDTAELRGKEAEITQLKNKIREHGKDQVVETVAYTWFNRLMALRFMDANGYTIPKVVTPLPGMTNPEILQNALGGNVEPALQIDRQRLNDLLDGKTAATDAYTEAYKMLLVASCNQWHTAMPFMFERISDYTELLLPDDLLSDYSIVADIRNCMSDGDCHQEEILGWLYQFYISDENERLIQSKSVYKKHELAPASQLFTPKWIVKYMVDNTLGQLWSEIYPSTAILSKLEFYIKPGYKEKLPSRPTKRIEDIKFFEPCVGSGHILSYAFDVFYHMYEEQGYNSTEIPELIIKHNLFGIDIDERAAQIASFVLMMKGRRRNSRLLRKNIKPNITFYENFENDLKFCNCKAIGSLVDIEPHEIDQVKVDEGSVFAERQVKLKQLYTFLGQRYDCVVTNPPYISSDRMEGSVKQYLENFYSYCKSDLFAAFLIKCLKLSNENGLIGYICPFVWMFNKFYEKMREHVILNATINNLIQLEYNAFEPAVVPICTFTLRNSLLDIAGDYIKLSEFKGHWNQPIKTLEAIHNPNVEYRYSANQKDFKKIEGSPLSYWVDNSVRDIFEKSSSLENIADPRQGMKTSDNDRFIRIWHEISFSKIGFNKKNRAEAKESKLKWFPYDKGGSVRKWYGNNYYVINWEEDGKEIIQLATEMYKTPTRTITAMSYYFREGLTWSALSSSTFSIRYTSQGFLFDAKGSKLFMKPEKSHLTYIILGFMNSTLVNYLLGVTSPTLDYNAGPIKKLPFDEVDITDSIKEEIESLVRKCLEISKYDWDSREISWDFLYNPIINLKQKTCKAAFAEYEKFAIEQLNILQHCESELNKKFISIYGLEKELDPIVPIDKLTVLHAELNIEKHAIRADFAIFSIQLISYSIGCMFGRYSLEKPGLILASQGGVLKDFFNCVSDSCFLPDEDNIIPVLEGEWFKDDIVGRFKVFLKAAFGEEHFEENLKYVEETIGKDIRKYFAKDFYNDHIKRYKKRPIYWMFSSPKGHFKALIYMHRYQPDLCSKLLNDYLQTFISKLEAKKQSETRFSLREDISTREKTAAIKEIDKLDVMIKDCRNYEKTLFAIATQKIAIDLDDGVKVNYQKFKDVLIPIKGLEKEED